MDTLVRGYGLDVEVAWQTHRHLTNHLEPDTSTPPEDGEVEDQEGAAPKEAGNEIASSNLSPHIDASTQIDDAGRDPKTLNELERRMWQQWQAHPASGMFWYTIILSCSLRPGPAHANICLAGWP